MGAIAETQKRSGLGQHLVAQNRLVFGAMNKIDENNDSVEVDSMLSSFLILDTDKESKNSSKSARSATPV